MISVPGRKQLAAGTWSHYFLAKAAARAWPAKAVLLVMLVPFALAGCSKRSPSDASSPQPRGVAMDATPNVAEAADGATHSPPQAASPATDVDRTRPPEIDDQPGEQPAGIGSADVEIGQTASALQPNNDSSVLAAGGNKWQPTGSWTTRRLVALAPSGPCLIELSLSIGEQDIEQAASEMLGEIASELLAETPETITWEDLLAMPLVRSGWLGNLVADEEQQETLISMYDTSADGQVDRDELPAFLSRGLSRSSALQLIDAGTADDVNVNDSPWGIADENGDLVLDAAELSALPASILRLDLNGDAAVGLQEVSQNRMQDRGMESMSRASMLDEIPSVVFLEQQAEEASQTAEEFEQRQSKQVSNIVKYYTSHLDSVSREQWPNWSDAQWKSIDLNEDQRIQAEELEALWEMPAQGRVFVRLPAADQSKEAYVLQAIVEPSAGFHWKSSLQGGQLTFPGGTVNVRIDDAFGDLAREQLRSRLQFALGNAQLKAFFTSQLQLSDGAFEVLDADGDLQLDDQEFDSVWRWLSARQAARLVARWSVPGQPWFQLADQNADGRISEPELRGFPLRLRSMDANGDQRLTPDELPLTATLELSRSDSRLAANFLDAAPPQNDQPAADWFAAMDTNRDGVLNKSEFLGSQEAFAGLDSDKDGFVARDEVVVAP